MPGNPLTDPNWAPDLAEQITSVVGAVRDKTTNNAIKAARALVFGILGLVLGTVVVVLLLVTMTRGMQSLFDIWFEWDKSVYLSYFSIGGIFTLAGMFVMTKRNTPDA